MSCDGHAGPPWCPDGNPPMKSRNARVKTKKHPTTTIVSPNLRPNDNNNSDQLLLCPRRPGRNRHWWRWPPRRSRRNANALKLRHVLDTLPNPVEARRLLGQLVANAEILATTESDADDMGKPRDDESFGSASTAGSSAERGSTASPLYRRVLEINGVCTDDFGEKIPPDVQALISEHIRKARMSPKLDDGQKSEIREGIKAVWNCPDAMIADLIKPPLFPVRHLELAEGRDTPWSTTPLPRNPEYCMALAAPKTDRHYGLHPGPAHWTAKQLSVADHPVVRPYSQPTQANIFPFFLMELTSEATGGTLFEAEGQLATSGAHRVASWNWMQQQSNSSRELLSADAVVFSAAVTQRQVAAHVHYFSPEDGKYWMSLIDTFTFSSKDGMQGCRDYVKNVVEWMVNVQKTAGQGLLGRHAPVASSG
ncbi:hypothetical protein N0V90_012844 [Kalmusia sp. IMI 367209]|nr:hypothetical protein N0V90_012844 [Kalmusia sp. IMI 367209]